MQGRGEWARRIARRKRGKRRRGGRCPLTLTRRVQLPHPRPHDNSGLGAAPTPAASCTAPTATMVASFAATTQARRASAWRARSPDTSTAPPATSPASPTTTAASARRRRPRPPALRPPRQRWPRPRRRRPAARSTVPPTTTTTAALVQRWSPRPSRHNGLVSGDGALPHRAGVSGAGSADTGAPGTATSDGTVTHHDRYHRFGCVEHGRGTAASDTSGAGRRLLAVVGVGDGCHVWFAEAGGLSTLF